MDHDSPPAATAATTPPQLSERKEAVARFYQQHRGKVIAVLMKYGASRSIAEDMTQEAFVVLYQKWPKITDDEGARFQYLKTTAIRHYFKNKNKTGAEVPYPVNRSGDSDETVVEFADDNSYAEFEQVESPDWIKTMLDQLTLAEKQVMELGLEGKSIREIADKLGKTEPTVRQHIHNARKKFRKIMDIPAPRKPAEPPADNITTDMKEAK